MKQLIAFLLGFFYVAVLVAQPVIQWSRTMGGTGEESARSVKSTPDGGCIVSGFASTSNGDVFGNHGGLDLWVIKLSETGATQWKKCFGGSNQDFGHSVDCASDGGFIVSGYTRSNNGNVMSGNHGIEDIWLVKLNAQGSIQWEKTYGGSGVDRLGDYVGSMERTVDNGYILAGYSNSTDGDVTGNHGLLDIWVVKTDDMGTLQWQKSYGGSSTDAPRAIHQTSDGGYIIIGDTNSNDGDVSGNHGDRDVWVLKINAIGDIEWHTAYGGSGQDIGKSIQSTSDGGYIVSATTESIDGDVIGNHAEEDIWVFKLDSTGHIQWQKYLYGHGWEASIFQTIDDGYIFAASKGGPFDFWILKLNPFGDQLWQTSYGGSSEDRLYAIDQSADGSLFAVGTTDSNDGDVSGFHGLYDNWMVKLSPPESVGIQDPISSRKALEIFPNPAQQSITVKIGALPSVVLMEAEEEPSLAIHIFDLLGRSLLQLSTQNGRAINISVLPTGLYVITATTTEGKIFVQKFRKE